MREYLMKAVHSLRNKSWGHKAQNVSFGPDKSLQEPITRSVQLSHVPITAFSQTDLFLV